MVGSALIRVSSARYPLSSEIQYARILKRLVRDMETFARAEIDANGPAMIAAADADYRRQDRVAFLIPTASGFVSLLIRLLERIGQGITSSLLTALDRVAEIRASVDTAHRADWSRQLKQAYGRELGINILNREPDLSRALASWEAQNTALIKTIPPQIVERLRGQFTEAFIRGTTMKELTGIVQETANVGRSRASLIARDQIGKLNGQLSALRQQAVGIDSYIWRTMRDERVRPKHRALDGKTRKWNEGIIPGSEIRCRCIADPVFPGMEDILQGAK